MDFKHVKMLFKDTSMYFRTKNFVKLNSVDGTGIKNLLFYHNLD